MKAGTAETGVAAVAGFVGVVEATGSLTWALVIFGELGFATGFLVFCSLRATASAQDLMGEKDNGVLVAGIDASLDSLESILNDAFCEVSDISDDDGNGELGVDEAVVDGVDNFNADA